MNKKIKYVIIPFFIFLLHIKNMFFCLQTDEQYFMVLSQRIANGLTLLKDCYDIHQTSAVFTALLLKLKYIFIDSNVYDMLYLKSIGLFVHTTLAYYIYKKLKPIYQNQAFIVAILFYAFTPKLSIMPDYALMQYHILCLLFVILFTNRNCKIIFGILCGLLCIVYPPFSLIAILLIFTLYKPSIFSNIISCFLTLLSYFLLFIRSNIIYIGNLSHHSMHNDNFFSLLYMYIKDDYIQIILLFFILVSIFIHYKNSFTIISILVILIQIYFSIIKKVPYTFHIGIILSYVFCFCIVKDKKQKIFMLLGLLLPITQLFIGNQGGFICLRYLMPIVIICFCFFTDKRIKQFAIITMIITLLPMLPITSSFYAFPTKLCEITSGSLKGCFVDEVLLNKLGTITELNAYLNHHDVLIMDSDSVLYNYTSLNCNSPIVSNTPVFDTTFVNYYDHHQWPEYIIKYINSGLIDYDDIFERNVSSFYSVKKYKDVLIFEKGE